MSAIARQPYSPAEETANVITHAVGAGLSVAGLSVLVVLAAKYGDALSVVSASIFGAALVLLYSGSIIYHCSGCGRFRAVAQAIDHAMIYILIAGTYTPYTLVTLKGETGWLLFGIIWGLAAIGVIREFVWKGKPKWLSMVMYLAMGWLVIGAFGPLAKNLSTGGLWLLISGGLSYTVGAIFYGFKKIPFTHAVWHVFVLGGSVCHFLSVALYVVS